MTENGLDIQTISTKRTDFQADRVLLLGQVTEKKRKSQPFAFFKISFMPARKWHIWLCPTHKGDPSKAKRATFCSRTNNDKDT